MIKINGFEHVSWAASELEPGQGTLALFGIKPTGPAKGKIPSRMIYNQIFKLA